MKTIFLLFSFLFLNIGCQKQQPGADNGVGSEISMIRINQADFENYQSVELRITKDGSGDELFSHRFSRGESITKTLNPGVYIFDLELTIAASIGAISLSGHLGSSKTISFVISQI